MYKVELCEANAYRPVIMNSYNDYPNALIGYAAAIKTVREMMPNGSVYLWEGNDIIDSVGFINGKLIH